MPRCYDENEGDLEDSEYPDESDFDDDDTEPCPHCGEAIYDDAEQCPHCGKYLSREDAPPQRRPWWFVVGFLLCMIVVLYWILIG